MNHQVASRINTWPISSHLYLFLVPFYFLYTAGPCWLFILNIAVYTCQSQAPTLSPQPLPSGNHKFILSVFEPISVL